MDQNKRLPLGEETYWFDHWKVYPGRGLLKGRQGTHERLPPRVMDLLVHLIRRAPALVSKQELLEEVWNGQVVSDDALSVAVYELRKALGDRARDSRWIETVPRRGYRFCGILKRPGSLSESSSRRTPPDHLDHRGRRPKTHVRLGRFAGLLALGWLSVMMLGAPTAESAAQVDRLLEQGEVFLEARSEESLDRAEVAFRLAVSEDEESSRAWSALARCLVLRADLRLGDRLDLYYRARSAASKALELDPNEGQAHLSLGSLLLLLDWNVEAAGIHLAKASELLPDDTTTLQVVSWWHSVQGDHQAARDTATRAVELDPFIANRHADLAFVLLAAGDFDGALSRASVSLELDPGNPSALAVRFRSYLARGEFGAALAALDPRNAESSSRSESDLWAYVRKWSESMAADEALITRAALAEHDGRRDRAFALLERAAERRDWEVLWLEYLPELRSLHEDPRFRELLKHRRTTLEGRRIEDHEV